ncbi:MULTISPECIES: hypothetical protein [unclassified Mycolicibacterium]|uniref:hypothetical protein n=1 Tax=unclassified Mycolicibacterium TaxID=2636767 RepID=UPI002EDBA2D4
MRTVVSLVVCLVIVVMVPVTGCRSDAVPNNTAADADLSNPDTVITNALTTMFTWDPTKDASPDVAYQRAAVYMSGDLAGQGGQSAPGPGSQWKQWAADGAAITAKVYFLGDETPPNSDTLMHRVVVVAQTVATSDNRLIDQIRHTAWVTATKTNNDWRVTSIQF